MLIYFFKVHVHVHILHYFTILSAGYKIVIICSNEDEDKYIISKLQAFRRQYQSFYSNDKFLQYLRRHFEQPDDDRLASSVDDEK